ncbi:uncharacterized protein [Haliotis cracherodii]|uniref:uncharacterized protein isoform X1 n=2 Tax=Haliotis cracherodii TaxID=6455 RepID=UPI0039E79433
MKKQRKGDRKFSGGCRRKDIARVRALHQTKLKDSRREISMNLWIILAITWISISAVIADPKWFVHDSPLDGGDNEDLFSSEQLLPVQLKTHKNPKPAIPHITPKKQDQSHDKKVSKGADKPKPVVKQEANEIESENLILVHKKPTHPTGRKPLQVVDDRKRVEVKTIKTDKKPVRSPQILDEEEPCDPEKDIDCLLETEDLILVSNKKVKQADAKRLNQHVIKHDLVETMKKKEDIKPEVKKTEEAEKSALHRRLLQRDGLDPEAVLRQKPALQPLLEEVVEEEEEEEDVLANEIYSNDQQAEEIIRRFKRQSPTDEDIGSGDGGGASFMNTTDTTETPSFTMRFNITMDQKHSSGPLTPEEKTSYKDMFKTQLDGIFSIIPGTKVVVKNIRLDENNRVTADWDLVVTLTGARGTTDTTETQNLLDKLVTIGIPAVNNMTINGSVVYTELNGEVIGAVADLLLKDTCQADNACPSEYVCVRDAASLTYCHHKCYSSGLIGECQNGGACQINDNYEPYCQCGTGYSGTKCEQAPSSQSPSYTIGQIVGAGVGAAMMVIATASCCIYIAFFRKKKEEDMDYSYFGDDDSSGPGAFSDADTALGISNYYIDRPSVSLTPLDIYHQTGTHA